MGRLREDSGMKYPDLTEFYQRKEAGRKASARRPLAEKLAVATKLREIEERLASVRAANKAMRARKRIEIAIKTA